MRTQTFDTSRELVTFDAAIEVKLFNTIMALLSMAEQAPNEQETTLTFTMAQLRNHVQWCQYAGRAINRSIVMTRNCSQLQAQVTVLTRRLDAMQEQRTLAKKTLETMDAARSVLLDLRSQLTEFEESNAKTHD